MAEYCEKCELCHEDGLSSQESCPWYGEPCGCNHPERGILKGAAEDDTLDGILAEMRKHAKDGVFVSGFEIGRLADRIEKVLVK